jgi:ABC-type nitrate/sulfonate/bicarbonate transport system substrate-binding protein
MAYVALLVSLFVGLNLRPSDGEALETVNLALSNKNFQMILYPIAQERGYMQEEGIDLRIILARADS